MSSARIISHIDLDSFFVSVERLQNSKLNNIPVIIGGGSNRGVVSSCSYEARQFGVHSAMPIKLAKSLCPNAIFLRGDMERYSYYSKVVTSIIHERVPLYEKSSIDEFYIDLTGVDRFFGSYQLMSELRKTITKETGLPISFGMSSNKSTSKVATGEAKPNGQIEVKTGYEKPFLAPLSVQRIPMLGEKTYQLLRQMGVVKIATLQQIEPKLMERTFGKNGISIWKKANGIDSSLVVPYREQKSISTEQTFGEDTINVHQLRSVLIAMAEKLGFKLRNQNKLTACVTVKIRYANFDTHTQQLHIPYTASDHQLIQVVLELFQKLYQRRMRVRLVGVRVSSLVPGGHQMHLFEDTEELMNLYQAIDTIKARFGTSKLMRASSMGLQLRDFNPFNGQATNS